MADELKRVDLKEHPEADLSANAEKGALLGGATGVVVGALAGTPLGPGGAALGAMIGGALGAVGTAVVIAAVDTQGEEGITEEIEREADEAIDNNPEPAEDSDLPVARSFVDGE